MIRSLLTSVSLAVLFCFISSEARSADFSVFITSNLEGRFSLQQDAPDPALLILQSLYKKRSEGKPVLYVDLGNAFYPGLISGYSFGSAVYDYLDLNGCAATVVSSRDIRVGIDNLLQLENDRSKLLLSATICRDGTPVFLPWVIKQVAGKKIALLALSGDSVLFDITDKMTSNVTRAHSRKAAAEALDVLSKREHPDAIILLSGLNAEQNLKIMNEFPALSLCLSGGDAKGTIYAQTASQIILSDGRQILLADTRKGYFTVECSLTDRIAVKSFSHNEPFPFKVTNESYLRFENRLSLWKSHYLEEQSSPLSSLGNRIIHISDDTAANLMRDSFRSELSVITPSTMQPFDLTAASTNATIVRNTSDDFYIYRFKMKGSDINAIAANDSFLLYGYDKGNIQGYPVKDKRLYTVTATQPVYEKIMTTTGADYFTFENTWKTIPDTFAADISGPKRCGEKNFAYLDNRIGFIGKIKLSNTFNTQRIRKGDDITPPTGMNSTSYSLLNLDDSADFIFYNRYHMLTISPYINYVREKWGSYRDVETNLYKQVFLYQLNTNETYKPYFKSQYQMPIERVEGRRAVLIRETSGVDISTQNLTANAGAGVSKQICEPARIMTYGLEATAKYVYPLPASFKYKLQVDSFLSHPVIRSFYSLEVHISNGINYSLTDLLSASLAYKYSYYHDGSLNQKYTNKAILFSLDFATSFSFF